MTHAAERRRRNHALWIGPLITFLGGVSYFMVFARFPTLRDFPWVNLPLVLIGLGLSTIGLWRAYARKAPYRGKILGPVSFALSALICAGLVFYVFGMSYWLPATTRLTQGLDNAPKFSLVDHAGTMVSLDDYRGRKVVLTFYRGFW